MPCLISPAPPLTRASQAELRNRELQSTVGAVKGEQEKLRGKVKELTDALGASDRARKDSAQAAETVRRNSGGSEEAGLAWHTLLRDLSKRSAMQGRPHTGAGAEPAPIPHTRASSVTRRSTLRWETPTAPRRPHASCRSSRPRRGW